MQGKQGRAAPGAKLLCRLGPALLRSASDFVTWHRGGWGSAGTCQGTEDRGPGLEVRGSPCPAWDFPLEGGHAGSFREKQRVLPET